MKELTDLIQEIRRRSGEPLALATVVATEGHAYRRPGARMLINAEGPLLGSVSGGCLEAEVCARARAVLVSGLPEVHEFDLRGDLDLIWGSGSGCEGLARILVEQIDPSAPWLSFIETCLQARQEGSLATVFEPGHADFGRHYCGNELPPNLPVDTLLERIVSPIQMWIFGAGAEASPLLAHAQILGWPVGIVDHRPLFARPERFPGAVAVRAGHPKQTIPELSLDARSACLLLTHNFQKDLEALELLLPSRAGYVGLMGHRERGQNLLRALAERGSRPAASQLARLYTPVGLDLGLTSPEAIALSILAEIQAHFAQGSGLPLRDRLGALHMEKA